MSSKEEKRGELFVVAGPSGVGKSSLVRAVLAGGSEEVKRLRFSISYTTRRKRPGEVNGREYFFTDEETFLRMVEEGQFLEWARVHQSYYGTVRAPLEQWVAEGWDVLLDVDVQGAAQVRKSWPHANLVLVLPPSPETLRTRLRERGTEEIEEMGKRLEAARREVARWEEFDYVIVNDRLPDAARELAAIFLASRARRERRAAQIREIVAAFGVATEPS